MRRSKRRLTKSFRRRTTTSCARFIRVRIKGKSINWCKLTYNLIYKNIIIIRRGSLIPGLPDGHLNGKYKFRWKIFKRCIIIGYKQPRIKWRIRMNFFRNIRSKYIEWRRWKIKIKRKFRKLWNIKHSLKKKYKWNSINLQKWIFLVNQYKKEWKRNYKKYKKLEIQYS